MKKLFNGYMHPGWAFVLVISVIVLFAVIYDGLGIGVDDSDRTGFERSGLRVHTDAKTGVQYLSTTHGGLTPRLDAEGRLVRVTP